MSTNCNSVEDQGLRHGSIGHLFITGERRLTSLMYEKMFHLVVLVDGVETCVSVTQV